MPKPYRFLLFDFVNTLFLPDPAGVPTIEVDGKRVVSTAGILRDRLPEPFGRFDEAEIYRAHRDAWRWVESQRGESHREIHAAERLRHFCGLLGIAAAGDDLVQSALDLHMGAIVGAMRLPPEHRALLDELRTRFRMGILSNFDHSPPLLSLLEQHGIAGWFEPVVISADIGCRKPARTAFEAALSRCGTPLDAVLHVGDTWVADVEGAHGASIDVAWINLAGQDLPPAPRATYVIENLAQLGPLLA